MYCTFNDYTIIMMYFDLCRSYLCDVYFTISGCRSLKCLDPEFCVLWFLVRFRLVRIVAKSEYWLRHVCLSISLFARLSFHPSAWNNWAPTGLIFVIFGIWGFLKIRRKNSISIKSDRNKIYSTWRPMCTYNASPNSSQNEKFFQTNYVQKIKLHTLFSNFFPKIVPFMR
jgi:hypothetical protein